VGIPDDMRREAAEYDNSVDGWACASLLCYAKRVERLCDELAEAHRRIAELESGQ